MKNAPYDNPADKKKILILGGARSGKSHYAETLAMKSNKEVIYLATAKVLDNEISERVKQHRLDRLQHWQTIEEPIKLADTLRQWSSAERVILVDCLTMWVNNLLTENNPGLMKKELDKLISQLAEFAGTIIFVSNEVGMGIIPMGELSRLFVDETGRLHQRLAQQADQVILMVAGLPHQIK